VKFGIFNTCFSFVLNRLKVTEASHQNKLAYLRLTRKVPIGANIFLSEVTLQYMGVKRGR
jgi:hypothetical protein